MIFFFGGGGELCPLKICFAFICQQSSQRLFLVIISIHRIGREWHPSLQHESAFYFAASEFISALCQQCDDMSVYGLRTCCSGNVCPIVSWERCVHIHQCKSKLAFSPHFMLSFIVEDGNYG